MDVTTRGPREKIHSRWNEQRAKQRRDESSLWGREVVVADGLSDGIVDEEAVKWHDEENGNNRSQEDQAHACDVHMIYLLIYKGKHLKERVEDGVHQCGVYGGEEDSRIEGIDLPWHNKRSVDDRCGGISAAVDLGRCLEGVIPGQGSYACSALVQYRGNRCLGKE